MSTPPKPRGDHDLGAGRSPLEVVRDLVAARRSGTIVLRTPRGPAEIRIADGEVLDAAYLRADGERALFRILSLASPHTSFVESKEPALRRIRVDTRDLLERAPAEVGALSIARASVAHLEGRPLVATTSSEAPGTGRARVTPLSRALLHELRHPCTLDELLDVAPGRDTEILAAVLDLEATARLRALPSRGERVPLGTPEQLGRLRARLLDAQRSSSPRRPRIVLAGAAHRLAILAHCCACFDGAHLPPESAPALPVPHVVAWLPLGEGFDLEVVVCPLVPAYAPLWPQALGGSLVVVRLDEAAAQTLEEACATCDARVLDAGMLIGPYDESEVAEVATLLRAAVEA